MTKYKIYKRPKVQSYHRRLVAKNIFKKLLAYILVLSGSVIFLLPFFWMLTTSFKPQDEIFTLNLLPTVWTFQNYVDVFQSSKYVNVLIGFRNTLLIVIPSTVVGTLTAALAAFGFAKIRFPGRDGIFFFFVATMAIPGIVLMIPSYILYSKIGWTNTWLPLMIPGMFGGAGAVFFTRQFMKQIPHELEEAARVDGMSWWGIFWKIELPLTKPIIISNLLFGFIGGYNDWVGPNLYLMNTTTEMKTLQQMISLLNDSFGTKWGVQMAGSCLAVIPTLIIFIICQKFFIEGVSLTGGKDV